MENYSPSTELIDILLKNGFTETTEKHFKQYYEMLLESNEYEPYKHKRCFSLNNGKDIYFDYVTIRLSNGSKSLKTIDTPISKEELISIIAFYKLPHQTRSGILRKGNDIKQLITYVESARKHSRLYSENIKRIEKAIESVII